MFLVMPFVFRLPLLGVVGWKGGDCIIKNVKEFLEAVARAVRGEFCCCQHNKQKQIGSLKTCFAFSVCLLLINIQPAAVVIKRRIIVSRRRGKRPAAGQITRVQNRQQMRVQRNVHIRRLRRRVFGKRAQRNAV